MTMLPILCVSEKNTFHHFSFERSVFHWNDIRRHRKVFDISTMVTFVVFRGVILTVLVWKINPKQECIPVGCVPAAHWPYAGVCFSGGLLRGGGCLLWGVSALGGSAPRGSAPGGDVCSRGGVSALRGVCSRGCLLWGVCSRGCVSALWGCVCSGGSCSGGCLLWGLSPPGGLSAPGGCLLWRAVYPSMDWGRHPPC